MKFALEQPAWLWILVLVPAFALVAVRAFVAMSGLRKISAIVLRAMVLCAAALLLAGLHSVRESNKVALVAVVDMSDSVRRFYAPPAGAAGKTSGSPGSPADAGAFAREFLSRSAGTRGAEDLVGVVVFDGVATAIATPSAGPFADRAFVPAGAAGTNIAEALRLARALVPADAAGRIVLFSDGNQTSGDGASAAAFAASRTSAGSVGAASRSTAPRLGGATVDVVPLSYALAGEVVMESLDAPPAASARSTINLRVVLRATAASEGVLRVSREGAPIDIAPGVSGDGLRVKLVRGRNVFAVEADLASGRVHRFEATYEPDTVEAVAGAAGGGRTEQRVGLFGDTIAENNSARAFTITPGRGAVLVMDGVSQGREGGAGSTLSRTLERAGLEVTTLAPDAMPTDVLGLQNFDVVILENIAAEMIPTEVQKQLIAYVSDIGGGLVMVGGPDSYAAGGWRGSEVEKVLPVLLDLPDRVVAPEVATVFVLDASGSMNRYIIGSPKTQIQVARDATALAIASLEKNDLVGVVTFNGRAEVVVPLGRNVNPAGSIKDVKGIFADGGTNIPAGMTVGIDMLSRIEAKHKHMVVMTDGKSMGESELPGLADECAAKKIKLTTIAVGDDADLQLLAEMAERGKGTYHHAANPAALPKIFLKAVRVERTPPIREQPFAPALLATGSPMVAGLGAIPNLGGLNLTQVRREPTATLAMVSPLGEPVLAHWPVGLGQVVAFTSDAHKWADNWLEWPGYERLWGQIVRASARPTGSANFVPSSAIKDGVLKLRLEATQDSGEPWQGLATSAVVFTPMGESKEVVLAQSGPGVYEGEASAIDAGSYVAILKPAMRGGRLPAVVTGATTQENPELRFLSSDEAALAAIARAGGGRVLDPLKPEAAKFFDRAGLEPAVAMTPLWSPLMIALLGLLLADIATRRVAWDRFLSPAFREKVEAKFQRAQARVGQSSERSLGSLRTRAAETGAKVEPVGTIALSQADASDLARAARDRRRSQRLGRPEVATDSAQSRSQPAAAEVPETVVPQADEPGLLAAKRRAAKRFDDGV